MRIRKIVIWALMLSVFAIVIGCSEESKVKQLEAQNKAVVRRALEELWNTRNLSICDEVFDPNCTLYFQGKSYPFNPNEAKETIGYWLKAFPDFKFTIEDMVAEEDKVAVRLIFTGTHKGEFYGIAPTGKKISVTQTEIDRLVDGKIVESWEDFDQHGMFKQLGMELKQKDSEK